jgi:hypothetical protein
MKEKVQSEGKKTLKNHNQNIKNCVRKCEGIAR